MSDALKNRLYQIIFKTETKEGRAYDIFLILSITLSTLLIIFESVDGLFYPYRNVFSFFEWFFVIIFSIEYILRLYVVKEPLAFTDLLICFQYSLLISASLFLQQGF